MPRVVTVSAANSTVTATGAIADDGVESAACGIRVLNTDGNPMAGLAAANIVLAVSGAGNTVTQPTGVTDSGGYIEGSFVSTTAATKTVSWTVLGQAVTATSSVVVSGTPSLYPNQPSGFTNLVDWDGSPRGTTDAFGVADFTAWNVDGAAPAGNLEVVADATNPTGSGDSLTMIWNDLYSPRCATAIANPIGTGAYSEIYVGFYIKYLTTTWNHKFFYFGTPSVSGSELWTAREAGGRVRLVTQGFTGQAEIIDTDDASPKGISGADPMPDADTWYFVEMHCIAESTPGAGDGYARMWVDGSVIGTNTAVLWGTGNFGSIEWYAQTNTMPSAGDFEQRLGGLRIAGKA